MRVHSAKQVVRIDSQVFERTPEREEKGRKFDPASVKGAITIYQIQGTGAVILN